MQAAYTAGNAVGGLPRRGPHALSGWWSALRAAGQCKLDLQLVSQEVESVWLSALYPVNAMRNRALAGADTDVSEPGCSGSVCFCGVLAARYAGWSEQCVYWGVARRLVLSAGGRRLLSGWVR